jgi:transcriptional regulator NrdR family protein
MTAAATCECGGRSETIDGRRRPDGTYRRRRACTVCGKRWTTIEMRIDDQLTPDALARARALTQELTDLLKEAPDDDRERDEVRDRDRDSHDV